MFYQFAIVNQFLWKLFTSINVYLNKGSAHDARIYATSNLNNWFESGRFGNAIAIGDSAYKNTMHMATPFKPSRVNLSPAEQLFQESIIRTRNIVERAFGVWKNRFCCSVFTKRYQKSRHRNYPKYNNCMCRFAK